MAILASFTTLARAQAKESPFDLHIVSAKIDNPRFGGPMLVAVLKNVSNRPVRILKESARVFQTRLLVSNGEGRPVPPTGDNLPAPRKRPQKAEFYTVKPGEAFNLRAGFLDLDHRKRKLVWGDVRWRSKAPRKSEAGIYWGNLNNGREHGLLSSGTMWAPLPEGKIIISVEWVSQAGDWKGRLESHELKLP